jgi:hypothetical protein
VSRCVKGGKGGSGWGVVGWWVGVGGVTGDVCHETAPTCITIATIKIIGVIYVCVCVCVCVRVCVCRSDEYNNNCDKVQVRTKQQRVEM